MKRRSKLRLKLTDEARLEEKWNVRFSLFGFIVCSLLIIAACIAIGIATVWFTPLKTRLPGYMKESQRSASADMLLRLDSIVEVNEMNQRYLDNIMAIIGSDTIQTDSIAGNYRHGHFTPDSLSSASEKEIQYVLSIQQKKEGKQSSLEAPENGRINISNLNGDWETIGVTPTTKKMKIKVPSKSEIGSIGDGIILLITPQGKEIYSVMVQHPSGYISLISGLTQIAVKEGEAVKAAALLGKSNGELITIQMWRNGMGLNPGDYSNKK